MRTARELIGARIERVDQPHVGLLCLTLWHGERSVLGLIGLRGLPPLGVLDRRPPGDQAQAELSTLRRCLKGARITNLRVSATTAEISTEREQESRRVVCEQRGEWGRWLLLDAQNHIQLASTTDARHKGHWQDKRLRPFAAAEGPPTINAQTIDDVSFNTLRASLIRAGVPGTKRLQKRLQALERDLQRLDQADELQRHASIIMSQLHAIKPGQTVLQAQDWEDPGRTLQIPLDPRRSAVEHAEHLFHQAKRRRRGRPLVEARVREARQQLAAREEVLAELHAAADRAAIETALTPLGNSWQRAASTAGKKPRQPKRLPYRQFLAADGTVILVGRGPKDNDHLTLRIARPHHPWLHARGAGGAHVVVLCDRGQRCSGETLLDAATLAVHFSQLKDEERVDVIHTERRFVHKRKGAPLGSVTLSREKVLILRTENKRLHRLLASEQERNSPL